MAGGKKKKKPASNPARGFATTSIASKPKVEAAESELPAIAAKELQESINQEQILASDGAVEPQVPSQKILTAEEFEKQLEESELQVLVEKHAAKSKRDAARQRTRLETDRRVLRGQAESLNTRKWLPPELMEEILELVHTEGRFAGSASDVPNNQKQASEEELTIRLWTLQQALIGAGFPEDKVLQALRHVLEISDRIGVGNKDVIWGIEESLDWLARECSRGELPDYESWQRKAVLPKSYTGRLCSFIVQRCPNDVRNTNRKPPSLGFNNSTSRFGQEACEFFNCEWQYAQERKAAVTNKKVGCSGLRE